jgi:ribonuclease D
MNVQTVDTPEKLGALCNRVRTQQRVGLDTEFHGERTYVPRLMLMQLAFEDGTAIIDPLAVPQLEPLVHALQSPLVVGHALQSDLKIFADRFGAMPARVFDTQIAAAFLGYGMQVSLSDLVNDLCDVRLAKSQTVSDWSARPLSGKQIEYLVDDVAHLLDMHEKLVERLRSAGRLEWVLEECAALGDIERYRMDERRAVLRLPGAARMSRRELGVLMELVRWRDAAARRRDVPVKYILADDILAGLATLRPKRAEDLAQLRRLEAGARRSLGEEILAAVQRGERLNEDDLPEKPLRPFRNNRDNLVSLLNVAVGEVARANDLPASLLVPRAALERVAREAPSDRDALARMLDVSPWRTALVVEPLWRLVSGSDALRIEGYLQGDPEVKIKP